MEDGYVEADAKNTPSYSLDLHFLVFYRAYSIIVKLFYRAYAIFEHITGPLSGLFWRTEKCRSKDLRGGVVLLASAQKTQKTFW